MRFHDLDDWLAWQETLHPKAIDPGLDRSRRVARRLGQSNLPFVVIAVAGTNGKGSCVALLESVLRAAGYRVGAYTSPHLCSYNERVRLDNRTVEDALLVAAFDDIDRMRGDISLTYFEFGTLAAVEIFRRAEVDVALLEVGMGGRLDAVNVYDPQVALVTTVDIDHVHWLGGDRETIAREKAGIFRPHRPAVFGEKDPPLSLLECAKSLDVRLFHLGRDFGYDATAERWSWWSERRRYDGLPTPRLAGRFQLQNSAAALMVLELVQPELVVDDTALREGVRRAWLPGRFHRLPGAVTRIFDVAHNRQATRALAEMLQSDSCWGVTRAVVGALADKDLEGLLAPMVNVVDRWYLGALPGPRGASAEVLAGALTRLQLAQPPGLYGDVVSAYEAALSASSPGDRVVGFGSFFTVGDLLRLETTPCN